MFKPKTYAHLCSAMQTGAEVTIDRTTGVINKLEREDGSGYNWIATVQPLGKGIASCLEEPVRKFIRVES